jgi:hypothetical protein
MINWAVCVRRRLFPSVRYYTSMSGGNKESHEKLGHYSRSAGRNVNPRPTEYDSVLSIHSRHTVYWGYNSADERVEVGEAGTNCRDPAVCKAARGPNMLPVFVCLISVSIRRQYKLTFQTKPKSLWTWQSVFPIGCKVFSRSALVGGP